jgi:hypothetical protein
MLRNLETLQQVYISSSPTAWGSEKLVQSGFHTFDHTATSVLLATTNLQHWRNEGNIFLDRILIADKPLMHSFEPQLK